MNEIHKYWNLALNQLNFWLDLAGTPYINYLFKTQATPFWGEKKSEPNFAYMISGTESYIIRKQKHLIKIKRIINSINRSTESLLALLDMTF